MRLLRIGLAIGLLAAASACGGDDGAATTTAPPPATTERTEPATTPVTTTPPTTEPVTTQPTTTQPATTQPTTTQPATTQPTTTQPATTQPATTQPTTTEPPATTTTEPTFVDVKIHLLREERLAIAHRQVAAPAVLRGALTELVAGPSTTELAAGLHSSIPAGTTLLDVALADGQATVDLSGEYDDGGGSSLMKARLAQVIFTATQFDNVDRVVFRIDGEQIEYFSEEGLDVAEPQRRRDVDWEFTAGVIFDTPAHGATVSSPFTVTGEGDVYEGDFPIWVHRDGEVIAGPFVAFAGAWGEWEDFEATITLDAPPGPIELIGSGEGGCSPDIPDCWPPLQTVLPLTLTS